MHPNTPSLKLADSGLILAVPKPTVHNPDATESVKPNFYSCSPYVLRRSTRIRITPARLKY